MTEQDCTSHPYKLKDVEKGSIIGNALDTVDTPIYGVEARDLPPETAGLYAEVAHWLDGTPKKGGSPLKKR